MSLLKNLWGESINSTEKYAVVSFSSNTSTTLFIKRKYYFENRVFKIFVFKCSNFFIETATLQTGINANKAVFVWMIKTRFLNEHFSKINLFKSKPKFRCNVILEYIFETAWQIKVKKSSSFYSLIDKQNKNFWTWYS